MKVLVFIEQPVKAWTIPESHVDELRARFPGIEFVHVSTPDEAQTAIRDADVAFTHFLLPEMVAEAPKLKWVQATTAGVAGAYPLDQLSARRIVVTNVRGLHGVAIAEQVMAGLLALGRRLPEAFDAQRRHRWIQNDLAEHYPTLLSGKRLTIVGLGAIGLEIAKRADAFGVQVTGVRRSADGPRPESVHRVVSADRLHEALSGCQILVITAPGIAATQGMIGARELDLLEGGAILVNVARAAIVDQGAMLAALKDDRLGGAVLDVFEQEPLDESSPLWDMRNVILTPHSSGFRATHWDEVIELFSANLRRFVSGEPLEHVVDSTAGY